MKNLKHLLLLTQLLFLSSNFSLFAQCLTGDAYESLTTGDVTASLSNSGNLWARENALPAYQTGEADNPGGDVGMIFSGGLWLSGIDPGGSLVLAAATYGVFGEGTDYYPGPLTESGEIANNDCSDFNRFWKINKTEIDDFLADFSDGTIDNPIPTNIVNWPAKGNPLFESSMGFPLPNTPQGLAPFFDRNGDGLYHPEEGDVPFIKDADQGIWWVINDAGGYHIESGGDIFFMEIQTLAYSYNSAASPINTTTFYDFRFINRYIGARDSVAIGLWIDPDFGCVSDDYFGCDPTRNLAYIYNADAEDGGPDCGDCSSGETDFCGDMPILGIKVLKGTERVENGQIIDNGMSHFMYHLGPTSTTIQGMHPPQQPTEYFNYLYSHWKDGTALTSGGTGYNSAGVPTRHAFPGSPDDANGWSLCAENQEPKDYRFTISSGYTSLQAGAVSEMSIAVFKAYGNNYPCPNLDNLFEVDDIITDHISTVTSIKESVQLSDDAIALFPNPMQEVSILQLVSSNDYLEAVNLYSLDGKQLRSYQEIDANQLTIERKGLASGIYIFKLQTRTGKWKSGKIIVP